MRKIAISDKSRLLPPKQGNKIEGSEDRHYLILYTSENIYSLSLFGKSREGNAHWGKKANYFSSISSKQINLYLLKHFCFGCPPFPHEIFLIFPGLDLKIYEGNKHNEDSLDLEAFLIKAQNVTYLHYFLCHWNTVIRISRHFKFSEAVGDFISKQHCEVLLAPCTVSCKVGFQTWSHALRSAVVAANVLVPFS